MLLTTSRGSSESLVLHHRSNRVYLYLIHSFVIHSRIVIYMQLSAHRDFIQENVINMLGSCYDWSLCSGKEPINPSERLFGKILVCVISVQLKNTWHGSQEDGRTRGLILPIGRGQRGCLKLPKFKTAALCCRGQNWSLRGAWQGHGGGLSVSLEKILVNCLRRGK